jgi:hypothetical protein
VVEGEIPASFVLALIERLPEESMTIAQFKGGREKWREHFGWSRDRHMLADLFDVIQVNTEATGQWKKKPPELPRYPRPQQASQKKKPLTVAQLHAALNSKVQKGGTKAAIIRR